MSGGWDDFINYDACAGDLRKCPNPFRADLGTDHSVQILVTTLHPPQTPRSNSVRHRDLSLYTPGMGLSGGIVSSFNMGYLHGVVP